MSDPKFLWGPRGRQNFFLHPRGGPDFFCWQMVAKILPCAIAGPENILLPPMTDRRLPARQE